RSAAHRGLRTCCPQKTCNAFLTGQDERDAVAQSRRVAAGTTTRSRTNEPVQESIMKRSDDRILTSHVGSLPRPMELLGALLDRENGKPYDAEKLERDVRDSVNAVVAKQAELGIDIVNDGEHSKSNFAAYTGRRIGGFELTEKHFAVMTVSKD